jgi:hypothetical protein
MIVINKQTNKQFYSINENRNIEFIFKTFMKVFDITNKCYKLAYTYNMKIYAIVPFQYFIKTWWKVV